MFKHSNNVTQHAYNITHYEIDPINVIRLLNWIFSLTKKQRSQLSRSGDVEEMKNILASPKRVDKHGPADPILEDLLEHCSIEISNI